MILCEAPEGPFRQNHPDTFFLGVTIPSMRAPTYRFDRPVVPATFLARPTRFTARIRIDGRPSTAHINSSGRMQELLVPGRTIGVSAAGNAGRRSPWDVKLVKVRGRWMSIDSMLPNRLVRHWLTAHALPEIDGYTDVRREVQLGGSRFDFMLTGGPADWVIEVKSVTLNVGRWGVFPDAPTERGARHVRELADWAAAGRRCAVVWLMAHPRMERCWANPVTDPAFTEAVARAAEAGVRLLAYQVDVNRREARLAGARVVETLDADGMSALQHHVRRYADVKLSYTAAERKR